MNEIAHRLNAYIQSHPFDAGDSGCETVLEQLYQAYAESHESDPAAISDGFKELEEFLCVLPSVQCIRTECISGWTAIRGASYYGSIFPIDYSSV